MYKVILVDDEILVREAMRENVDWAGLGYQLVGDCEDGRAAISFTQSNEVDLILTDIFMPFVDGMELSRYIYENYPEIQVVIFSGYGEFEYAKKAMQYNVFEYLLKPVTAKELSECLLRVHNKLEDQKSQKEKIAKLTKVYSSYTKNTPLILSGLLSGLIKGTSHTESSLMQLNESGIDILGAYYRVGVIDIDFDGPTRLYSKGEKRDYSLLSFVVENISMEIASNHKSGFAFRDADNRISLLFRTNSMKGFSEKITSIIQEIQQNCKNLMGLIVSICVGPYVTTIESLNESYQKAQEALAYGYTAGKGFAFEMEKHTFVPSNFNPELPIKSLVSQIQWGHEEEVQNILEEFTNLIHGKYLKKEQAGAYLQQLIMAISDSFFIMNNEEEVIRERNDIANQAARAPTFSEGMQVVCAYANKAMQVLAEAGQSSGYRQAILAVNYIKENYANTGISLNDICRYLNISTSHFSSIFKEATGETFMETLTRIRMERAEQLLQHTDLKNYEIAEKVGFSDPHYFNVAFKKMHGITPKEYAREKK